MTRCFSVFWQIRCSSLRHDSDEERSGKAWRETVDGLWIRQIQEKSRRGSGVESLANDSVGRKDFGTETLRTNANVWLL